MTFYTYHYFLNHAQETHFLRYFILIVLLILLLVIILKTFRSKNKMKYRDLIILISLVIIFTVGIQINDYKSGRINRDNSSRMIKFLDNISKSNNTPKEDLAVNSKYLKNEILVKIGNDYYQVDMNSDLSSFKLEQTNLMDLDKVKVIKE